MKRCTKCGTDKPVAEYDRRSASKDGFESRCKECRKADLNAWLARNPEWVKKNREKNKENKRNARHVKLYGITLEDHERLQAEQQSRCAICKAKQEKLHVDHCHKGGHVRGLLCFKCNTMLGLAGDDIKVLQQAIEYLGQAG